jgi:DNA-directed RNA polymerase specialized sigma24 family protein
VQIEEAREFENLAQDSLTKKENELVIHSNENPEESLTQKQTSRDVAQALQSAIAELEPEDRLILKMYYFDEVKLKDIGASFGFHEATASRKLVRIQTEIRKSVEKILTQKNGWKREEVSRHLADAAAKLDLSFEKLIAVFAVAAFVQDYLAKVVL